MNLPQVVSPAEWESARAALLVKEKQATRARDALAAERRRLPMVRVEKQYAFEGPNGEASLLDLFDGRRQLIVYHHMLQPGDADPCSGCSMVVDSIVHLAHLYARDTSLAVVSRAPSAEIEAFKKRMGWPVPWFSSPPAASRPTSTSPRASGSMSSSATATRSSAATSPRGGVSRRWAAAGPFST